MLRQFRSQILERFLSMRLNGVRTAQIFRHIGNRKYPMPFDPTYSLDPARDVTSLTIPV